MTKLFRLLAVLVLLTTFGFGQSVIAGGEVSGARYFQFPIVTGYAGIEASSSHFFSRCTFSVSQARKVDNLGGGIELATKGALYAGSSHWKTGGGYGWSRMQTHDWTKSVGGPLAGVAYTSPDLAVLADVYLPGFDKRNGSWGPTVSIIAPVSQHLRIVPRFTFLSVYSTDQPHSPRSLMHEIGVSLEVF